MGESTPKTTCDLCMEESRKKHFKCSTEACVHPVCIECCAKWCSEKADFKIDCPFCKTSKMVFTDEDIDQLKEIMITISIKIASETSLYVMSVTMAFYTKMKLGVEIDTDRLDKLLTLGAKGHLKQWDYKVLLDATKELVDKNLGMFVFENVIECLKLYMDVNEYIGNKLW